MRPRGKDGRRKDVLEFVDVMMIHFRKHRTAATASARRHQFRSSAQTFADLGLATCNPAATSPPQNGKQHASYILFHFFSPFTCLSLTPTPHKIFSSPFTLPSSTFGYPLSFARSPKSLQPKAAAAATAARGVKQHPPPSETLRRIKDRRFGRHLTSLTVMGRVQSMQRNSRLR